MNVGLNQGMWVRNIICDTGDYKNIQTVAGKLLEP